jgi:hypothetical protein
MRYIKMFSFYMMIISYLTYVYYVLFYILPLFVSYTQILEVATIGFMVAYLTSKELN